MDTLLASSLQDRQSTIFTLSPALQQFYDPQPRKAYRLHLCGADSYLRDSHMGLRGQDISENFSLSWTEDCAGRTKRTP